MQHGRCNGSLCVTPEWSVHIYQHRDHQNKHAYSSSAEIVITNQVRHLAKAWMWKDPPLFAMMCVTKTCNVLFSLKRPEVITPMVNIWHSHIFPKIEEQTYLLSGKLVICLQPDTIILHNMNHRQSTYNLSVKTKWQNGVTQGAVYCHLASYRKSSSFV